VIGVRGAPCTFETAVANDHSSAVEEQHTRWTTATVAGLFIGLAETKRENWSFGNGGLSEMRYR
jgi:hypothetical protein